VSGFCEGVLRGVDIVLGLRSAIDFVWCFCSKNDKYDLTQPELHYIIVTV
jgi:hypothetical protein